MFRSFDSNNRNLIFAIPLMLFALVVIGQGSYIAIAGAPAFWTYLIALVAGIIICGPFSLAVGQDPGFPFMGVSITMLALHPVGASVPLILGFWAIGILISQTFLRNNLLFALYTTGLSTAAAFASIATLTALTDAGLWTPLCLLLAIVLYYTLFLLGEFLRQRGRWARDRSFGLSGLDYARIGYLIVVATVASALIYYCDEFVIPWLEGDPNTDRTAFLLLLNALLFYVFAQRRRYSSLEHRLSAVLLAAAEWPRENGADLTDNLKDRIQSIVQADSVELRGTPPAQDEIGAVVGLTPTDNMYLIASRKISKTPFARADQLALAALAHVAGESARIHHDVSILKRQAESDPLTKLPNYGAFQRALIDANENRPYHEGIAVLFMDLDNFKQLNDNRGHHAGDGLLQAVARRLEHAAGGGDFVSRVGGDEFVVILTGLTSLTEAKASAEKIVAALSEPLMLDGKELQPVVSAGLAFSSHQELNPQNLVIDADRTMLQTKRSRRQGGPTDGSSLSIATHRSTRTNDIIARAIRNDMLVLAFQPIVSIDQDKIWAFEALVRYVDPELGPISPSSLVARAKSLGLMDELTKQIITKALDAAEKFHRLEPSIICITVNLELSQISETELGPFIRESARAHPNLSLCIELNERSLRSVTDDLRREAELLQEAGIIIALDDYGSDDSSVGALVRFPMDILKIDRSLVDDLEDARQREVLKALQTFGDNLDYTMVVEGVESAAMVDILTGLGVRSAQGYYYGRPLSFAQTMDRIERSGTRAAIQASAAA